MSAQGLAAPTSAPWDASTAVRRRSAQLLTVDRSQLRRAKGLLMVAMRLGRLRLRLCQHSLVPGDLCIELGSLDSVSAEA